MRHLSICISAIALLAASPLLAKQPQYRQFQDWSVACDNTGRCSAASARENDDEFLKFITLQRDAGANGVLQIEFTDVPSLEAPYMDGKAVDFGTGSKNWINRGASADANIDWPSKGGPGDASYYHVNRNAADVLRFLDSIKNGKVLVVGEGEDARMISLNGLRAALLFIDEAQGRLNTPTALIQRGPKSLQAIPAASPLPKLAMMPRVKPLTESAAAKLVEVLRKQGVVDDECTEESPDQDAAYALTAKQSLVLLQCTTGAYNIGYRVFVVPNQLSQAKVTALGLVLPRTDGLRGDGDKVYEFTNAYFNPKTGDLSHSVKGRGIGDCGESATWRFDGKQFRIASYALEQKCAGSSDWPQYFRSNVSEQR